MSVERHLSSAGKHYGYLSVQSGGFDLTLPYVVVAGGQGPTVLLIAGVHGDEYEGVIALAKLSRELQPEAVNGRVIILPFANPPALKVGKRVSPLDGRDLNRSFPGKAGGAPTEHLAHLIFSEFVSKADIVLDFHTGGTASRWFPCSMMHPIKDVDIRRKTFQLIVAMNTPAALIVDESDKVGMLDSCVEGLGKIFACCEFGGGIVSRENIFIAESAIWKALGHLGVIDRVPETLKDEGAGVPVVLEAVDPSCSVESRMDGFYEPSAEIRETVMKDQPVGYIHPFNTLEVPPDVVHAPIAGVLAFRRVSGRVQTGDRLALIGRII